jgi:hypothetical protein
MILTMPVSALYTYPPLMTHGLKPKKLSESFLPVPSTAELRANCIFSFKQELLGN